jgi:hypothetical protein
MTKTTFRHNFSKPFVQVLIGFSKDHESDDRKVFKAQWDLWIRRADIQPMINDEIKLLHDSGFEGDALDKMFKSCRYYFRTKSTNEKDDDKKERKPYVALSKCVLQHMDEHIKTYLGERPEDAYNNYCNQFTQKIKDEIQSLSSETEDSVDDIYKKYKKTYKNRFYVLSKKQ